MLNAARSLRQAAQTDPLPAIPALWKLNERFQVRRGELVMIAGIPNSGKSAFVLWWVASLNLPTLYFSADNGPHTTLTRLLSYVTQTDSHAITEDLDDEVTGKQVEAEYLQELAASPLNFCFDGALDLNDITDMNCTEANIFDQRPDPKYATGAITHLSEIRKLRRREESGIRSRLPLKARASSSR